MVELIQYLAIYEEETISRIADFFGFHIGLLDGDTSIQPQDFRMAKETLAMWQAPNHEIYIIQSNEISVGFIHIGYRGGNVAWIEDIFVDKNERAKGIATAAIYRAEEIIRNKPDYTAVCLDVSPRNENALRLYHKLGYNTISLITVRKEFYENKRGNNESFLGLNYKI